MILQVQRIANKKILVESRILCSNQWQTHDDNHGKERMTLGRSTVVTRIPHGGGFNVFSLLVQ